MEQLTLTIPELPPEESRSEALIRLTLDSLPSNTRRAYTRHLDTFFKKRYDFTPGSIKLFLANTHIRSPSSAKQARAAILQLARHARDEGLCSSEDLASIEALKCAQRRGKRLGRWLTLDELTLLVSQPAATPMGQRDGALLGLLAGCGLRREEACTVIWHHWQQRKGRWMLVDVVGKGNKLRSVPVPEWASKPIREWYTYAMLAGKTNDDYVLCNIRQNGQLSDCMTPDGVYHIVRKYALMLGYDLSPHDLRRTLAKLMHDAGAGLDQIQYMLGHESITTTMAYVGECLEIRRGMAGVDKIRLGENDRYSSKG